MGRAHRRNDAWGAPVPRFRRALGALAVMGAALAAPPVAAAQTPLLPDLVADPPANSAAPEIQDDGSGSPRLLLRFDGFVHNRGQGALELRASDPSGTRMNHVVQRIYNSDGSFTETSSSPPPQFVYEEADGHNHWHVRKVARYSLWNQDRSAEVAASPKIGFCLIDSQPIDAHARPTAFYTSTSIRFCQQGQPAAPEVVMGISPGWRDVYGRSLAFQWVDISDVQPGAYWLRSEVDPGRVIVEADEDNPVAFAAEQSIVPGYLANPQNRGTVPPLLPSSITLSATRYDDPHPGAPGAVQFKIVSAPSHGTLDKPAGTWFSGSQVIYTPRAGYSGPDSFSFAARDSASAFPRSPAAATVRLTVDRFLRLSR